MTRSRSTGAALLVCLLLGSGASAADLPTRLRPGDLLALSGYEVVHIDPATGQTRALLSTLEADPRFEAAHLEVGLDGSIYLSDYDRILRLDPISGDLEVVSSATVGGGRPLNRIRALALGPDEQLYYPDPVGSRLDLVSVDPLTGVRVRVGVQPSPGDVRELLIALPDGRFVIGTSRLYVWSLDATPQLSAFDPIRVPYALTVDDLGQTLYGVTFGRSSALTSIEPGGGELATLLECESPTGAGPSSNPTFTSVAAAPDGIVYAATAGDVVRCEASPFEATSSHLLRIDTATGAIDEVPTSEERPRSPLRELTIVPQGIRFPDDDGDGEPDAFDNCPSTPNGDQADADGNGVGDACNDFEDFDGDDFADSLDACPEISDPGQEDADGDGLGDPCDPFPHDANHRAAELEGELDRVTGELAMCRAEQDEDGDLDGIPDWMDRCLETPPGEPIDGEGCSLPQFCESIVHTERFWRAACARADWADPSPGRDRPRDCRVRPNACEAR